MNSWSSARMIRKISSIKEQDLFIINQRILEIRRQRLYQNLKSADATIVWERISNGYRIVDLQLDTFIQALRFVLTNFSQTEPLSKAVGLCDDAVSMRSFLNKIFDKMNENLSFCALQDGSSELVGVLVASTFNKARWEFALKYSGEGLRQIMMLRNYAMAKALFYETENTENPVRIDVFCVKLDHQKKGIGTALLRSCLARASAFASTFVGEFTSGASQTIARRLQFEVLYELPYKSMESEVPKLQVFEDCYPENYSIACMAAKISPPVRYQPSITSVSVRRRKPKTKSKKTRKRK